jgi:hypothetical protein
VNQAANRLVHQAKAASVFCHHAFLSFGTNRLNFEANNDEKKILVMTLAVASTASLRAQPTFIDGFLVDQKV